MMTCDILSWEGMQYILRKPEEYDPDKQYPILLFLHGAGTRGTDLTPLASNPFFKITAALDFFPFITIAPLCHADTWFDLMDVLQSLVRHIAAAPYTDAQRIYLMGNSMGGYATWQLAMSMPEYFAAICPICGGGLYWNASRLVNVPVWAFHGAKDDTVYVQESIWMTEAINRCGGQAKLTIYPENGHNSWSDTYTNPEVYQWLLSHTNKNTLILNNLYTDNNRFG